MTIRKVAVMGAGQMGNGIAQVAAQAGFDVVMRDVEESFTKRGLDAIGKNLGRAVKKERMTQAEADDVLARVTPTTDLKPAEDADLVIEAIVENLDVKAKLWGDLDAVVKEDAIFASNTSSIPITVLAGATNRPQRFIGMHFFNPVPVMQLVELIRGVETADDVVATVKETGERMGKTVVEVRDYPGFISNRVLMPMLNEAMFALHEGVAGVEEIDTVMKMGMNHPMGPLELADFIGLDTCLYILDVLYDGFKDPKYRAAPILTKKVQAKHFGRKAGRGFYVWENGKKTGPAL
jgi:3-hydroxybutyryl-CoA dehydrogenase